METDGDAYARALVRFREIQLAIDLVRQAIDRMPEDPHLAVTCRGRAKGEAVMRVEQPRGELLYYVKGSGQKVLDRVRIRTPDFRQHPVAGRHAAGDGTGRRAGRRAVHRPVHFLHRALGGEDGEPVFPAGPFDTHTFGVPLRMRSVFVRAGKSLILSSPGGACRRMSAGCSRRP